MVLKRILAFILAPLWGSIAFNVAALVFFLFSFIILYIPAVLYTFLGGGGFKWLSGQGSRWGALIEHSIYNDANWSMWIGLIVGVLYGLGIFFMAVVEAINSEAPFNKLAAHAKEVIANFKANKESR